LIKLTVTYKDGRTTTKLLHPDAFQEVDPDPRPGSVSKAIVKLKDGTKLYVVETIEQIATALTEARDK
jgi:hypothetical protein